MYFFVTYVKISNKQKPLQIF